MRRFWRSPASVAATGPARLVLCRHGNQLPGIEAAGLQVEAEAAIAIAAVAGQFAPAGQGGAQGVEL